MGEMKDKLHTQLREHEDARKEKFFTVQMAKIFLGVQTSSQLNYLKNSQKERLKHRVFL